jgi:catechol 2,3-dioxygenase-like lactoylglutathione lyase family enzyme
VRRPAVCLPARPSGRAKIRQLPHERVRFAPEAAGITGFSRIGLNSTDPARDERFWTEVCNARVSDRIGDIPRMRVNAIHHTIALVRAPKAGIQHINHQVETSDDVLRSYYFINERRVPIVFGPGRHPTSGARFLYFKGPGRHPSESTKSRTTPRTGRGNSALSRPRRHAFAELVK